MRIGDARKYLLFRERPSYLGIASVVIALSIWELVAGLVVDDPFIMPRISSVFIGISALGSAPMVDVIMSLFHFGIGLGLGVAVGVPVGAYMGWFAGVDSAMNPFLQVLRPIPPLAWVPFAIGWFGLSNIAAGFIVFIGAVFPIILGTYSGFRNVPRVFVDVGRVFGCNRVHILLLQVVLPAALPEILTGIRIGNGVGWMSVMAAEVFGRSNGIGYELWQFYQLHEMGLVVGYMMILGLVGLMLDYAFRKLCDRFLLRWQVGLVR